MKKKEPEANTSGAAVRLRQAAQRFAKQGPVRDDHDTIGHKLNAELLAAALAYSAEVRQPLRRRKPESPMRLRAKMEAVEYVIALRGALQIAEMMPLPLHTGKLERMITEAEAAFSVMFKEQ